MYGQNPTHAVNRMFLVVCGVLFYYEFTEFEFLQASDVNVAFQWLRLDAFWYLLPVAVLHICIIYSNFRVRRLALASMYGSAILFSLLEAFLAPYELFKMPWGWAYRYTGYYGNVQVLWVILPTIAALLVLIRRYHDVKSHEEKTGVVYVLSGVLIPVITGIFVTVLPFLTSIDVPDLTTPAAAIGFLLVGYAVFRYGIHILTASAAADDILSTMVDALFLVDREGEIIESNQAASRLLEFETSELTGKQLNTITKDSKIMEAFLGNNSLSSLETDFKTKQEQLIPVSVSKSVVVTKRGNLVGYVLVCRDIAERKLMEERLLRSERLAAIGETAAMVGHDLRNPLQGIAGALYLLKQESLTAEERKEMLQVIEKSIHYSDAIIKDLLDYSAEIKLKQVEATPKSITRDAMEAIEVPQNVTVQDLSEDQPTLRVDLDRMKRVFINLIENAIDAMPQGGTLTISSRKSDGNVEITLTDTGSGISEKIMENLWKPLRTTKAKGLGLGLAICKRIVDAHGGSVSVKSEVGRGTTLTIQLPIRPVEVTRK